ncbi:Hypothetical protein NTJ_09794 [Nesidiocoris tenuis]|uniref:Uncharacterized protein n=1 Tax=Nesidiocoris tenuis TaxID=355587 RepID=A0ABN7AXS1_9HEMI|nr:Hypothetical protein NTJ_09794 [Nesidiocoris tenuis]
MSSSRHQTRHNASDLAVFGISEKFRDPSRCRPMYSANARICSASVSMAHRYTAGVVATVIRRSEGRQSSGSLPRRRPVRERSHCSSEICFEQWMMSFWDNG